MVTQNSGVMLTAKTSSYATADDANPILGDAIYYGRVFDIIELNCVNFFVTLFKCEWVDVISGKGVKKDKKGYTLVNFSHLIYTGNKLENEPFIFANQAVQVLYVEDQIIPGWSVVMKSKPRDVYDTGKESMGDIEMEPFHVSHLGKLFNTERNGQHWVR
jgi:hypothetical protein